MPSPPAEAARCRVTRAYFPVDGDSQVRDFQVREGDYVDILSPREFPVPSDGWVFASWPDSQDLRDWIPARALAPWPTHGRAFALDRSIKNITLVPGTRFAMAGQSMPWGEEEGAPLLLPVDIRGWLVVDRQDAEWLETSSEAGMEQQFGRDEIQQELREELAEVRAAAVESAQQVRMAEESMRTRDMQARAALRQQASREEAFNDSDRLRYGGHQGRHPRECYKCHTPNYMGKHFCRQCGQLPGGPRRRGGQGKFREVEEYACTEVIESQMLRRENDEMNAYAAQELLAQQHSSSSAQVPQASARAVANYDHRVLDELQASHAQLVSELQASRDAEAQLRQELNHAELSAREDRVESQELKQQMLMDRYQSSSVRPPPPPPADPPSQQTALPAPVPVAPPAPAALSQEYGDAFGNASAISSGVMPAQSRAESLCSYATCTSTPVPPQGPAAIGVIGGVGSSTAWM